MRTAISTEGLHKRYGERIALGGVDLSIDAGHVFCLLGPNGAGKTTAVEILEGCRKRTAGEVRVLGIDPEGQPRQLRERVGVVPQTGELPGDLRVVELIDAFCDTYPRPRRIEELLDIVELRNEAQTLIKRLSGGQRRRVELALALAGDPDVVFLDEPTTGFDPAARRRCWAAVRNLAALDKTVVLTTHYMDEANHLADRVAILVNGTVVAEEAPDRLTSPSATSTHISFRLQPHEDCSVPLTVGSWLSCDDGRFELTTPNPDESLYGLLSWARAEGVELQGLTVTPPTLEDIYLELSAVAGFLVEGEA